MNISQTDWKRIDKMNDQELTTNAISDPDNPPLDDNFFANAKPISLPKKKKQITLRIDSDIIDWFKARGKKYQTHINAVLKLYKEAH